MKSIREIAYKVRIKDLKNNNYVVKEGWDPNYVEIGSKNVSRVNILGIITSNEENNIILDDGTGEIPLRSFEPINKDLEVGDMVLVVGRPREFNSMRYIMPEIIKKIQNKKWLELRKLELEKESDNQEEQKEEKEEEVPVKEEQPQDNKQKILDIIKEMDKGEGVSTEDISNRLADENIDEKVKSLLRDGEIFEIKPGVLKLL